MMIMMMVVVVMMVVVMMVVVMMVVVMMVVVMMMVVIMMMTASVFSCPCVIFMTNKNPNIMLKTPRWVSWIGIMLCNSLWSLYLRGLWSKTQETCQWVFFKLFHFLIWLLPIGSEDSHKANWKDWDGKLGEPNWIANSNSRLPNKLLSIMINAGVIYHVSYTLNH